MLVQGGERAYRYEPGALAFSSGTAYRAVRVLLLYDSNAAVAPQLSAPFLSDRSSQRLKLEAETSSGRHGVACQSITFACRRRARAVSVLEGARGRDGMS